ncbi:MAG: HEPN domain-containing protein [Clostridia bacterium]|nr:HEPN domain-containing protein [Clostridia bacterium]
MESSINRCALWLHKSHSSLQAASVLFRMGHYCDSISRAYYAVFYSIRALFLQDDVGAYKPTTMLSALGKHYVNTGKMEPCYHKAIFQIFDLRFQIEYECLSIADMDNAKFALETAFTIVNEIKNNLIKEKEREESIKV